MARVKELKRPSAFHWLDLLAFGGSSAIATACAVYVTVMPIEATNPDGARALSWVVAATFWGIYALLIRHRIAFLARFGSMTKHGIMIEFGGYLATVSELEREVDIMLALYAEEGIPAAKYLEPAPGGTFVKSGYIWVTFKKGPYENLPGYGKVMGFIRLGGNHARVSYMKAGDPPNRTALAHELGHIALGRHWKDWSVKRHHEFQQDHDL